MMLHQTPTDHELLRSVREGNRTAFTILYERYWQRLFHIARRILEDEELAKDVVQECFVSLFEKNKTTDVHNLLPYLYQSVKFQCFMHLRAGRITEKHLQRINQVYALNVVEEEFAAEELQSIVDKKIASLPEKCREVFFLSRMQSLSNKKIAEQLNISTKTVENQITKALKAIRLSIDKLALLVITMFS